ncbi:MAG: hypothetical protein IJT24_00655 [Lachnospiraceae bacterium]|nr:hypothetical protein [Lachnospiraceae bacterium]
MSDLNMKLSDDMLEGVTGGAGRISYNDNDLKKAGVIINTGPSGKKEYSVKFANGKVMSIDKNVALDMCDCYKVAGNVRLSDNELKALIAQCQ